MSLPYRVTACAAALTAALALGGCQSAAPATPPAAPLRHPVHPVRPVRPVRPPLRRRTGRAG